ncbi:MAG: hypothetical protein KGL90_14635 [Burkholderiales bacterium]|nr:hypothetical protein [Burkholderiales bacterium]
MPKSVVLATLVWLAAAPALAQDDPDAAALSLADQTSSKVDADKGWQMALEVAASESSPRDGGPVLHGQRLSFDLQFDQSIAQGWRAVFSDQIDVRWQDWLSDQNTVNTLREAYLSWQPMAERALDLGRINARYGVALGYNPTDYFRAGAARSIVSISPSSLRSNRLGSVMLRGQTLWDGGSLTALVSPKLAQAPSTAPFSLDAGATNNLNRWLIALSQALTETIHPQWLLYGAEHQSPQLGANLTYLLNDATVAYGEWSGGRSPSQRSQALQTPSDETFRSRLATGLTYTTTNKVSLTAEYDYNGAALDSRDWKALARSNPLPYVQYRGWAQNSQELPTRQALFLYATWQDALVNHFDLTAMLRFNAEDRSRLSWLEARYHWDRADLALQWQRNSGTPGSEFGALPQQHAVQVLLRYFF